MHVLQIWLKFTHFAVYNSHGYMEVINSEAGKSMQAAVNDIKSLPDYHSKGEVSSSHAFERDQVTFSLSNVVGNH